MRFATRAWRLSFAVWRLLDNFLRKMATPRNLRAHSTSAATPEEREQLESNKSSVEHPNSSILSKQNTNLQDKQLLSASERLQRARQAHEALRRADRRIRDNQLSPEGVPDASKDSDRPSLSVTELAAQLSEIIHSEQNNQEGRDLSSGRIHASLEKIGEQEKDELILHLLRQSSTLRRQRDDAAALGEGIATQLVQQQHELRLKCRQRVEELERKLHRVTHAHPEVLALKDQVKRLSEANYDLDKQLRFSVVKLQQSRKRERELKRQNDPFWDL